MLWRAHSFLRPTSEIAYSAASLDIGVVQTSS
jgi:hypothetical protein